MRGAKIAAGAGAVALVAAAFAARSAGGGGAEVPVSKATRRELVQTVVASGRVLAPARLQLGATFTGTVEEVLADEGDRVRRGQVLVRLRDRELRAELERAQAGVRQAEARLARLAGVGAPAAAEDARQAALTAARAAEKVERLRVLVDGGSATREQLDEAEHALESARIQQRRAELVAAGSAAAGGDRLVAEADLAGARAALLAAQARLEQATLTAPADGTVVTRAVEPGDVVQPARVLLVLARDGERRLLVPLDEKNLALVQTGQAALASTEAYPEQRLRARVVHIAPGVDPQRGTVDVKLAVEEAPEYLRPDMTVSVEIEAGRRRDALVLPLGALRDAAGPQPFVLAVRGGKAERRPVQTGLRGAGLVEITGGLEPGDLAVIGAAVKPGERVRAREGA